MNFAFVVVVLAAVSGLASEVALRSVAPQSGPPLALFVMAIAVLVGASWRRGIRVRTSNYRLPTTDSSQ